MPRITIKNETEVPLHIALRHISPIHFINNVAPGQEAVFPHVGRVWFTVEARIARKANMEQNDGKEEESEAEETFSSSKSSNKKEKKQKRRQAVEKNNEYTMLQAVAAPVAVSVAALSLGAGAIYVGMAAGAAGSVTAALSSISAQVSTAAASQVPTARRLYKYAQKGQKVVQIGQVLGIGGGALLGNRAAIAQSRQQNEGQIPEDVHDELTGQADIERIKKVKDVLTGLIEKSAVRSHGWYMNRDRVMIIRGGPRAAELDQWLIIETDTVTPFEVLSQDPNDQPDPEGQEKALRQEEEKAEK